MATIKEMSDEYARAYLFSPQSGKGPDDHYAEGANAVLNEMESEIDRLLINNCREVDYEEVVMMVRIKIKELKGE